MKNTAKIRSICKRRKKLGDCLVEAGLISKENLIQALEIQKSQKKKIGQILIEMGVVGEGDICDTLATQLDIPLIRIHEVDIPRHVISLVPPELAINYLLIPIEKRRKTLTVAMANPLDLYAIDDLRFATKMPIEVAVSSQKDILNAIDRYYPDMNLRMNINWGPAIDQGLEIIHQVEGEEKDVEDLKNLSELPPIVRLVNTIIADAIRQRASDIHVEPQKSEVIIRYRVDGIMREIMKTNRNVHASLVSRMKVLSNMDISIRRKPQDGKTQVRYGNKTYDLRVSTIPLTYGEKVTIRVLDQDGAKRQLEELGLSDKGSKDLVDAISRPQGIVLVTGPTGSGKSSTLYACLNRLNSASVNIITVEDPVEFDILGINQVQINPQFGITFAAGLRSILRQDPDIVMVGEIRDSETASIAFQAAQTGHLVLSTLHTNDAPSTVTRLLDLGIPPFLISASLVSVVGQRLVRTICQKCKAPDPLSLQILEKIPSYMRINHKTDLCKGTGCEACQYTGYSGRMGIFEVLTITPSLKEIITPNVSTYSIRKAAEKAGFESMAMEGIKKAFEGLTTLDEVYRVAPLEVDMAPELPAAEFLDMKEIAIEKPSSTEQGTAITSAKPKKILVADDDEITLRLVRNFLESENYSIISARDGSEAMKLALQDRPDLMITDYDMPKMDGITLIKKLRSQLVTRFMPIIMLTVKDDEDSEAQAIDAGADDYITKPVTVKTLLARLDRLIRRPLVGEV